MSECQVIIPLFCSTRVFERKVNIFCSPPRPRDLLLESKNDVDHTLQAFFDLGHIYRMSQVSKYLFDALVEMV